MRAQDIQPYKTKTLMDFVIESVEKEGFKNESYPIEHSIHWQRIKSMASHSYLELLRWHEQNIQPSYFMHEGRGLWIDQTKYIDGLELENKILRGFLSVSFCLILWAIVFIWS